MFVWIPKFCLVSLPKFYYVPHFVSKLNITLQSWSSSLCRQIEIDSKFLELQQIMDYSLLLGVHYRAPQQLRPYNQSRTVDGLAILAEEGEYLSNLKSKWFSYLPLYGWYLFWAGIFKYLYIKVSLIRCFHASEWN